MSRRFVSSRGVGGIPDWPEGKKKRPGKQRKSGPNLYRHKSGNLRLPPQEKKDLQKGDLDYVNAEQKTINTSIAFEGRIAQRWGGKEIR